MPPEQKIFFVKWAVAMLDLMRFELFLRPFINGRVDNSGNSAWHFPPVRMRFGCGSDFRLPSGPMLCFSLHITNMPILAGSFSISRIAVYPHTVYFVFGSFSSSSSGELSRYLFE